MFNLVFFFFKQKPAYLLRISDLSSDVCSSALQQADLHVQRDALKLDRVQVGQEVDRRAGARHQLLPQGDAHGRAVVLAPAKKRRACASGLLGQLDRSEERRGGEECGSTCRSRWSP